MKVNVYIDGFNFYYAALNGTPYKWLDLRELSGRSLTGHQIHRIKYFTARVKGTPSDPGKHQRQDTYIRALRTLPGFTCYEGTFREREKTGIVATGYPNSGSMIRSIVREEKGSDVNLATELLIDGFRGDYEAAVIVSDDSDLLAPIHAVRRILRLKVGILNPQRPPQRGHRAPRRRQQLINAVTGGNQTTAWFHSYIDRNLLSQCQLPDPIVSPDGREISKPSRW